MLPVSAYAALGSSHIRQYLLPLPPPLQRQRWSSKSSRSVRKHHHPHLGRCCDAIKDHLGQRRSALTGVSLQINDSAGSLFPSDDSDYEDEILHGCDDGGTTSVLESSVFPSTNNYNNNSNGALVEGELQQSLAIPIPERNIKNGNGVAVGGSDPTQPSFDYYSNPIDFIADWCSDRFAEQSSSSSLTLPLSTTQTPDDNNNSNNLVESYPPGSALDVLSRASSSPYTPLSYQVRTIIRVGLPCLLCAIIATTSYPYLVNALIHFDNNNLYTDQVYTVLSNDLSQYVQNILTTTALLFGMLVGQTYFFMYLQQESVFYALFAEVTEAKSLLEQISLLAYGRPNLYMTLLSRMEDYIQKDLKLLSVRDPISATSGLMPKDDPLESILYATSVGLPSSLYDTVKSLREARSARCGALQRKLPMLHIYCLRILGCIVLCAFPVCGSGSVALATNVVVLQAYMFGVLAFGLSLILGVVEELRNSHSCSSSSRGGLGVERNKIDGKDRKKMGAYSVDGILGVMVSGLELELSERLEGKFRGVGLSPSLPTRVNSMELEDHNDDGMSNYTSTREDICDDLETDDICNVSSKRNGRRRSIVRDWFHRKVFRK